MTVCPPPRRHSGGMEPFRTVGTTSLIALIMLLHRIWWPMMELSRCHAPPQATQLHALAAASDGCDLLPRQSCFYRPCPQQDCTMGPAPIGPSEGDHDLLLGHVVHHVQSLSQCHLQRGTRAAREQRLGVPAAPSCAARLPSAAPPRQRCRSGAARPCGALAWPNLVR